MILLVRPAAAADIEDAYRWYRGKRLKLGQEFLQAVRVAGSRILENPEAFPVLYRDTRRIRLKRFPYGLFFKVSGDRIVIVACMHGRRDPEKWVSRA